MKTGYGNKENREAASSGGSFGFYSDVIVIGAGVLGCFLARSLRRYDLSVTVLEKADDVCTGISRGGSGIIYAGYDMRPGTKKARLTTQSCIDFPGLCEELGVRYKKRGSLMVGFGPEAEKSIRKKFENGIRNGVPGLRILDGDECRKIEPLLSPDVTVGLYAPGTCVVDPWELGIAAYENARENGARFLFGQEVTGIERNAGGFVVTTGGEGDPDRRCDEGKTAGQGDDLDRRTGEEKAAGQGDDLDRRCGEGKIAGREDDLSRRQGRFSCRILVNCAGLSSGLVHEMASDPSVRIEANSADYILLEDDLSPSAKHVIFHETETGEKGLTLIPTADGNMLVGQTEREGHAAGNPTEAGNIAHLQELCRQVVPGLDTSRIMRTFAIARPNPIRVVRTTDGWVPAADWEAHLDFSILEENGFFSLIGVKTPGLTCSNMLTSELADQIAGMFGTELEKTGCDPKKENIESRKPNPAFEKMDEQVGCARPNPAFDPHREKPVRVHALTDEERDALIRRDPAYGRIVCTCRDITAGEIRDAMRRGASTPEAVKRRTGALMGNCQGSRCYAEILRILAERQSDS